MAEGLPTFEQIASVIDYHPETGTFSRKVKHAPNAAMGFVNVHGYRVISVSGRQYYAHRLAHLLMTHAWPVAEIDQINGKRADNRWRNLRDANKTCNMQNITAARSDSLIGLKGVKRKKNRFIARIRAHGQDYYLGSYLTPEDAHLAYRAAKRTYHPEARQW
jgi:hypothetical protein